MEITILVENITDVMFLRQHIGEGTYGDEEIQLSCIIGSQSPVVDFRGERYRVSTNDIAKAICAKVCEDD